jgi:hypothetical protein
MRSTYAAIPSHVDPLRQSPLQEAADKKRQRGYVATVLFVVLFAGLGLFLMFGGTFGKSTEVPPAESADDQPLARACVFEECEISGCGEDSPHLCLDLDGPFLGCAASPWPEESCEHSCDTSDCAHAAGPTDGDSVPTCKGVACPQQVCKSYQQCGPAAEYMCIEGSASPGCSSDQYAWALAADTLCSSCCDTSSCL